MGDTIGSVFKSFKGPEDPGIKPTGAGGGGGDYMPTALPADSSTGMPTAMGTDPATGMPSSEHPYVGPVESGKGAPGAANSDAMWKAIGNQTALANSTAQMLRGMYGDLSRGPQGGSPLMARPAGAMSAYQPTARAGTLRLSDILGRR